MTFAETLVVAAAEIDAVIADDLSQLARRVRADLVATARLEDPPDWIEANVAAVLALQQERVTAWRADILPRYALSRHPVDDTRPS